MTLGAAGRSLAAGLALVLLAAVAWARPLPPGGTIALLGARSFGHESRVAELLDDMAAVTDVWGPSRFEVIESSGTASYADALRGRNDLRAVIALVGDLSSLDGIAPQTWPPSTEMDLTSRQLDLAALDTDLAHLRSIAERQGTLLLIATAPVGKQGRIEVPELLALHDHLREQGPVLDLARRFADLEPALLFANGIDTLDEFGHEELARALYLTTLDEDSPLPPLDAAERAARAEGRALQALFQGDLEALPALIDEALSVPPTTARQAARQAALVSWRDGLDAAAERWAAIDGSGTEVPGLAIGSSLSTETLPDGSGVLPSNDPVERQLVAVFETLAGLKDERDMAALEALTQAEVLVDSRPDRLDAWLALQVISAYTLPSRDLREEARDTLAQFPRSAVSPTTVDAVFRLWPQAINALPALLVATRPYARLRPTGPLLEAARRRDALGLREVAAAQFRRGMAEGRFPKTWRAELERLSEP